MFNMLYTMNSNQTMHRALSEDVGAPELRDRIAFMLTRDNRPSAPDPSRFELNRAEKSSEGRRCA